MTIPKGLESYHSEILRILIQKFQAGKTDAEIASAWGSTAENIAGERRRWGLYRDNECPMCGSDLYDGKVCGNQRCITNWVMPETIRKK
jgi:hypothetical protein